jgi:hypothetical protein
MSRSKPCSTSTSRPSSSIRASSSARDGDLGTWFENADPRRHVRYLAYGIRAAELAAAEDNRDYLADRLGELLVLVGEDAELLAEVSRIVGPLLRSAVD